MEGNMHELIYYPGFEVQNPDWLKFALLYIDKLDPIVPVSGDKYLTDLFRKLKEETDLIHTHRPDYAEGEKATLDAIDVVEKILCRPQAYSRIFRNNNVVNIWKHPANHRYALFEAKYTHTWEIFCRSNGLATPTQEGLHVPKELGLIYMTLLSQIIADSRGISPITDYPNLDRFAIFTRSFDRPVQQETQVAHAVLELKLPADLNRISLDQVIEFRNRSGFKERLGAFHNELNNYLDGIEKGSTEREFVNSFDGVWKDFAGDIARLGLDTVSFGLGAWILLNSTQITTEAYLKEIVVAGTALVVGSVIDIRKAWKNTETKRFTRKYLADLKRLQPSYAG